MNVYDEKLRISALVLEGVSEGVWALLVSQLFKLLVPFKQVQYVDECKIQNMTLWKMDKRDGSNLP